MKDSTFWASLGGFAVLAAMLFIFAFGFGEGTRSIAQKCDDYGKFKLDGKVYVCKLEQQP